MIVDAAVDAASVLVEGRRAGMEVLTLAPGGDGLGQIATRLSGCRDLAALHILCHGEPGALLLAGERIGRSELAVHSTAVAVIAEALAGDAEVALYGCSVASGRAGRRFLDRLEADLGVPVAASPSPVGATALGGGWTMRQRDGAIVEPAFSETSRNVYPSLLTVGATVGNDTLTGTTGADLISGLGGRDRISGIAGDDTLFGGDGNDTLSGGSGSDSLVGDADNDTLYGGDGVDTLSGGVGNDFLYSGNDDDILFGDDGNDGMSGMDGDDTLYGGAGTDTMIGGLGNDVMYGGAGNDWIWGKEGDDVLYGEDGSDTVSGHAGDDTLYGGTGDDVISGFAGLDVLIGGSGNDVFAGSASDLNGDTISDLSAGDSIVVDSTDLSSLDGAPTSASIDLGGGRSVAVAGIGPSSGTWSAIFAGGKTTISLVAAVAVGGGGGDSSFTVTETVSSGTDSDVLTNSGSSPGSAAIVENTGNNGNLVTATLPPSVGLTSEGPSTAQSGTEAETTLLNAIDSRNAGGESDMIGGAEDYLRSLGPTATLDIRTIVPSIGSGITSDDPIVINGSSDGSQSEAFVIDMRSITGKTLEVNNIEFVSIVGPAHVSGGEGNNYAIGDDEAQYISLGVGDDTLYGGGGADTIGSGSGNDGLHGDAGADTVFGGNDNDTLWGGADPDIVYGNRDLDLLYGNQGTDTLYGGQSADTVFGGQDGDIVYGNLGGDVLYGNLGSDTVYGGQGDDVLYGGQADEGGSDVLVGGAGNDTVVGGKGGALITTGDGADHVVVGADGGVDVVTDFDGAAGDRIEIAPNPNGTAVDTFAELQAAATDDAGGNAVIVLGNGNTLTLMGVKTTDLQAEWFSFD